MTMISINRGTAEIIMEITKQLEEANKLKEIELRLKYGDDAYFEYRSKVLWG